MSTTTIKSWAAREAGGPLTAHELEWGPLAAGEVELEVTHCGICHSDVHLIDDSWQASAYPLVPGHEIVGRVVGVGDGVSSPALGARVGVGWQAGACMDCRECAAGFENLCRKQARTCMGRAGGFAERVRVSAGFAFALPEGLASEHAAPLLCAGATVFAPLERAGVGPGDRVGIIGLGGLGHLAVQFAAALGAEVGVFSSSPSKQGFAEELGAREFVDGSDRAALKAARERYDFILSTVHADLAWRRYVHALRPRGTLCFVGAPHAPIDIPAGLLVNGQRNVAGSLIASRASMMAMLAFAAAHEITPIIETRPMSQAQAGVERVRDGEARFRVVLEAGSW